MRRTLRDWLIAFALALALSCEFADVEPAPAPDWTAPVIPCQLTGCDCHFDDSERMCVCQCSEEAEA